MSKAKVKKVKIPVGTQDEGLNEIFNQMLGTGVANIAITYPRYKQLKLICVRLIELFEIMANSSFLRLSPQFAQERTQVLNFCARSRQACTELFSTDFTDYEWNLSLVDSEDQKKFADVYNNVKKSELVRGYIILCDRLVPYRKHFEDPDNMNHKFITSMSGIEWAPFPFTTLNIKHIFSLMETRTDTIMFFMNILSKAYELTKKLYSELKSPDIDIDQFIEILMVNLDKIEKIPELNRCKEAFKRIRESVKLLKTNFTGYYNDFMETNDSTIIMQHFILDVSKSTDANAIVTAQFRKIISYYRTAAQSQIKNPKAKAMFDKINESLKSWEKDTENLVNITKTEESGTEEVDGDDAANVAIPSSTPMSFDDIMKK